MSNDKMCRRILDADRDDHSALSSVVWTRIAFACLSLTFPCTFRALFARSALGWRKRRGGLVMA